LPTTAGGEERSSQQTLKRAMKTRSHTKGNLNPVKLVPNVSYCSPVKGRPRQHFLLLCTHLHNSCSSSGTNCMVWEPSQSLFLSPLPHCTELRSWHIHQRSCGIHCYLHWAGDVARQLCHESICTYRQWTESAVPMKHAKTPGKREWKASCWLGAVNMPPGPAWPLRPCESSDRTFSSGKWLHSKAIQQSLGYNPGKSI